MSDEMIVYGSKEPNYNFPFPENPWPNVAGGCVLAWIHLETPTKVYEDRLTGRHRKGSVKT